MSNNDTHYEYHGAASDIPPKTNLIIWGYFVALGVFLYLVIVGMNILFQNEVDREMKQKVGGVSSKELSKVQQDDAEVLSGGKGVLEDKKNISIDDAMNRVVKAYGG